MSTGQNSEMAEVVLRALRWRYSVQKFDPTRKIPGDVWATLEKALVLTPSSFGLQPWKFVVVTNQTIKDKLVAASWNQRQVADASHVLVMAARVHPDATDAERYIERTAQVRSVTPSSLEGLKKSLLGFLQNPARQNDLKPWATNQVFIALGNFLTAAALLGVDACPMGGFKPALVDELLGLPDEGYTSVVLVPAGYRAPDDRYAVLPKVRFKAEDIIKHVP